MCLLLIGLLHVYVHEIYAKERERKRGGKRDR